MERLLNELVETLSSRLRLTPSLSKLLLHAHNWALDSVIKMYLEDASHLLVHSKLKPEKPPVVKTLAKTLVCPICIVMLPKDVFCGIGCSHLFCKGCWNAYLETQVMHGVSTGIFSSHLTSSWWIILTFEFTSIPSHGMHGLFCYGDRRLCLAFTCHSSIEGTLRPPRLLRLCQITPGTTVLPRS